jgi:hypothetical protein
MDMPGQDTGLTIIAAFPSVESLPLRIDSTTGGS